MHPVLEKMAREICFEIDGMNANEVQLRPDGIPHRWNARQVVEHLVLSYRVSAHDLEVRLQKGSITRHQKRTRVQWALQMMILTLGYIPRGMPALEETEPVGRVSAEMNGRQLSTFLREELDAMDAVLDRCRRRFGMDRVAAHPMLGPLRVDQWRRFHVVHGRHHRKQLRLTNPQGAPQGSAGKVMDGKLTKELQIPAQRPFA